MVLAGLTFPPDVRVEKEARALIAAGHDVHLLCDRATAEAENETWNEIRIHRIDYAAIRPAPYRRANTLARVVAHIDPYWLAAIRRTVVANAIDVIHVHDLPMVRTGLMAGRLTGKPVVADLHENYPVAAPIYFAASRDTWRAKLQSNQARWERYQRHSVPKCDAVITVVDEAGQRLVRSGVPQQLITVVENTEDTDLFRSMARDPELIAQYRDRFVILYVGSFGRHRGLDTAIEAMPIILEQIPDALLLLVGDGRIRPELQSLAVEHGVGSSVRFVGRRPFEEIPSFIEASDVCLVPHHSTPQTEAALPHKLFQYMALERAVVVSSCASLTRIVDATGAGLVFDSGESASLAEAVVSLGDTHLRLRLAQAGAEAASGEFDWSKTTSTKLLELYERLVPRSSEAPT